MNNTPAVVAIYCPLWHAYPHMDSWKGEGWTEWELLRTAPKRFPEHHQPLRPSWGLFDESDPKWAAREIALAADHGVDVFLFDWYWYSGVKIMEEVVENAFLKAPNRRRMKFALMWANHDWVDCFPSPFEGPLNTWLPCRHTPRDLDSVIDYCVEHYFRQPNYWQIEDRLFFSIFLPRPFIEQLGGAARTKRLLSTIDRRLHARQLPGVHWNAMTWRPDDAAFFKSAGFHSTTTYGINGGSLLRPEDKQIIPYTRAMEGHRDYWSRFAKTPLPHMPVVTMGWDVTPRARHDVKWPFTPTGNQPRRYPYIHTVTGNTPELFGELCAEAREHLKATEAKYPVVMINAWNEWTEGSYLLPEKRHGTGFLKAIKKAFSRRP